MESLQTTPVAGGAPPWARSTSSVVDGSASDIERGLTSVEAASRLASNGRNELDAVAPVPYWRRILLQFSDPLVILLLVAALIALVAWLLDGAESFPFDVAIIVGIVGANALLGLWQEGQAEAAVAALTRLTETHSHVIRDGEQTVIPSAELVPGDVLMLAEGDAVGADGRLLVAATLTVAEAPLTGESEPIIKQAEAIIDADAAVGDRVNMIFAGTAVASGRGQALVTATGMTTQMGQIATLLGGEDAPSTPLQNEISRVSRLLGIGVLVLTAVVVSAILLTSDISEPADAIDALLVGVSLAVAAVPEGLPAILSVILALGVKRMATENALVKKLSSVETLGSASVICTDKTGTLTRNEMTITKVVTGAGAVDVTGVGYAPIGQAEQAGHPVSDPQLLADVQRVVRAGCLANDATLREAEDGTWEILGDPTDGAFLVAEAKLTTPDIRTDRFGRVDEMPFTSDRRMMSTVNRDSNATEPAAQFVVVTKGAPGAILEHCGSERIGTEVSDLTDDRRREISDAVDQLADAAMRTLAVAYRPIGNAPAPAGEHLEHELILLGIVGIIDPPRPEVKATIEQATRAGIKVVMITGDHPRTATRIARDLGIVVPVDGALTGVALDEFDETAASAALNQTTVFARVAPSHKLQIVEALQASGNVVAMTGDGINDAPALRRADVGVAMGITGTEVSKEAADMILADDTFATILTGVREGRVIFANIAKFLRYLLSTNTGEVFVMFFGIVFASVLGLANLDGELAAPLLASHILWINLLTDTGLALALGVDPAIDDVMGQPPRHLTDRIIDRTMMITIGLTGLAMTFAGLIALDLELAGGLLGGSGDITSARTHVFTTLVFASVFATFNARSTHHSAFRAPFSNRLLWLAVGLTFALQVAVVQFRPLGEAFQTAPMELVEWATCVGLASSVLWVEEVRKVVVRGRCPLR